MPNCLSLGMLAQRLIGRQSGSGMEDCENTTSESRSATKGLPLDVKVFTRAGCHLCDEAVELLGTYGLKPTLIDIDQDPLWREAYDRCVPVVMLDGKVRFRGRINEVLLRRLLAQSRA